MTRGERALFVVSAFLLMAPLLVLNGVTDVLGFFGIVQNVGEPLVIDLGLRAAGAILVGALTLKDRAAADKQPPEPTARRNDRLSLDQVDPAARGAPESISEGRSFFD